MIELDNESTAIYPNRVLDKNKLERKMNLMEYGDSFTELYTPSNILFSIGYVRIVYGDHGPYIEFLLDNIKVGLIPKFSNKPPAHSYYEWLLPNDGSDIKVYRQIKDVKRLKNPPAGGFRGNRSEGYADYIPGMYYVNPYDLQTKKKVSIVANLIDF